jgi:hypothetical protein
LRKRQFFKLIFWIYPIRNFIGTQVEVPFGSSRFLYEFPGIILQTAQQFSGSGTVEVMSCSVPEQTGKLHEKPNFEQSVLRSRFESSISSSRRNSDLLRAGQPSVRSSSPESVKNIHFSCCPDRLWGPPSHLSDMYRRDLFPGVKWPGIEADHSPPTSAEWILQTVDWTPWTGDQPISRPLPTQINTNVEEKRPHNSCLYLDSNPRHQHSRE